MVDEKIHQTSGPRVDGKFLGNARFPRTLRSTLHQKGSQVEEEEEEEKKEEVVVVVD